MLDHHVSSLTFELFSSWEITGGRFFLKLPFVETSWMQAFTARLVCSDHKMTDSGSGGQLEKWAAELKLWTSGQ